MYWTRFIFDLRKRKKGGRGVFDKKRFRIAVMLKGLSLKQVAQYLGIDISTLYRKINGTSEFTRAEIQQLCELLELDDPKEIFFANELTETQETQSY